jgi:hypothetical protein
MTAFAISSLRGRAERCGRPRNGVLSWSQDIARVALLAVSDKSPLVNEVEEHGSHLFAVESRQFADAAISQRAVSRGTHDLPEQLVRVQVLGNRCRRLGRALCS